MEDCIPRIWSIIELFVHHENVLVISCEQANNGFLSTDQSVSVTGVCLWSINIQLHSSGSQLKPLYSSWLPQTVNARHTTVIESSHLFHFKLQTHAFNFQSSYHEPVNKHFWCILTEAQPCNTQSRPA